MRVACMWLLDQRDVAGQNPSLFCTEVLILRPPQFPEESSCKLQPSTRSLLDVHMYRRYLATSD
jgi:hypothetical protein